MVLLLAELARPPAGLRVQVALEQLGGWRVYARQPEDVESP